MKFNKYVLYGETGDEEYVISIRKYKISLFCFDILSRYLIAADYYFTKNNFKILK